MKKVFCCYLFLCLFVFAGNAVAEIHQSNALVTDIAKVYGYYFSQEYLLNEISKKFPELAELTLLAKMEFSANFKSAIDDMDEMMAKDSRGQWEKLKKTLSDKISSSINIDKFSEAKARQFIDLVRERAKGNIESPFLETLLLFKAGYEENPEREFLDGYKYKYINNGEGKANGIAFSIESPKTWAPREGNRPHVVQKFVSENGRGFGMFLVLINEFPIKTGENVTEKDIVGLLDSGDIKKYLPKGATYLNGGKLTLESLPGFWIDYVNRSSRMNVTMIVETRAYVIFYKNKMIQLQGHITKSVSGIKEQGAGLKQYQPLFDLMANSLVVTSRY